MRVIKLWESLVGRAFSSLLLLWCFDQSNFLLHQRVAVGLQFPSACPSYDYIVPNRKITLKTIDWFDGEGTMLPLQRYDALRSNENLPDELKLSAATLNNRKDQLTLESILKNITEFNLSHSSRSMLDQYEKLSSEQKAKLLQKIKAEERASQPIPFSALKILYCDAHICVVDKPSGILSVPGPKRNPSLATLVYNVMKPDIQLDQMVVHRLDMATSGIIVYALSLQALSKLHSDFKNRRVKKTYQALVHGHLHQTEGEIDVDLERDIANPPFMRIAQPKPTTNINGTSVDENDNNAVGETHKFWKKAPKESLTTWSLERHEYCNGQPVSRLNLRPWTGRTHQLRVHCAQALQAPIVGDDIYGQEEETNCAMLCLHAQNLCIYHPISGAPMMFQADTPF